MLKKTIAILGLLLLFGCNQKQSPEDQVQTWYQNAEEAISDKKTLAISELISPDYSDQDGRTKPELVAFLTGFLNRYNSFDIDSDIKELSVSGDDARIVSDVRFSNSILNRSQSFEFILLLSNEAGEWYLINSSYYLNKK